MFENCKFECGGVLCFVDWEAFGVSSKKVKDRDAGNIEGDILIFVILVDILY